MKMAIIMQCHKGMEQINRIIEFFNDDSIDIYIHIDKKSNIDSMINRKKNVNVLEERIDVKWGQFSQVEATLALFNAIKTSGKVYKYIHFISGQDYPIKTLEYIKKKFVSDNKQYIECIKMPVKTLVKNGADRYKVYYPQWIINRPKCLWKRVLRVAYREFVLFTKVFERNMENIPEIYYGSQWFSITQECMEYILSYIESNKMYYEFFKNSIYSDEMFFQTIIMNSKFKNYIGENNLRYLDWSKKEESPKNLEQADIDCAMLSDNIFARKIDSIDIIEYIDRKLTNIEEVAK